MVKQQPNVRSYLVVDHSVGPLYLCSTINTEQRVRFVFVIKYYFKARLTNKYPLFYVAD